MADGITLNPGTGGQTVSTDELPSGHVQRVKVVLGGDNVDGGTVASDNPLPVAGPLTDAQLRAAAVPVSGPLTDAQLRASAVPVTGSMTVVGAVEVMNDAGSPLPVSGSVSIANFPANQPVSGPLTDAQLRASAIEVVAGATLPISASALPLPAGAATQATLVELRDKFRTNPNGTLIVGTARGKIRDAFLTFDTVNTWFPATTGTGQSVSVAGATSGSRYLNIVSGTTANAETVILSRMTFSAPCSVLVGVSMSQRIANCDAFVEIVEVDPATGDVIVDNTIASPLLNNAANCASFRFTGTTATTNTLMVRQDGLSEESVAVAGFTTTAATGTSPNFLHAAVFEIALRTRDVTFSSIGINANGARIVPAGALRNSRVPNPDGTYAIRIRVRNGAVAPASTTDVRIHSVTVLDDSRISVDFGAISGIAAPNNAAPVQVANSVTLAANTPVLAAGTNLAGDVSLGVRTTATNAALSHHFVAAASTNAGVIKASAGRVYGWHLINNTSSWRYVKLHNTATAPTAGAGVVMTIGVSPNTPSTFYSPHGISFATGIGRTCVTGAADADTGATTANDVVGEIFFA